MEKDGIVLQLVAADHRLNIVHTSLTELLSMGGLPKHILDRADEIEECMNQARNDLVQARANLERTL